jgi:hypothetical protein
MSLYTPKLDIPSIYKGFNVPITTEDCGRKCAPFNPTGKPFCCDICQAVPVAYQQEWDFLSSHTDLWHEWRGDECAGQLANLNEVRGETPEYQTLLACLGPQACQREYRAISCRQFPFFPYVTSNYRFIGLAYYWEYEPMCWVISNLDRVTDSYRREFIATYDELFNLWPDEFEGYAALSEEMRDFFTKKERQIPVLHRNGSLVSVNPVTERRQKLLSEKLPHFGPYNE